MIEVLLAISIILILALLAALSYLFFKVLGLKYFLQKRVDNKNKKQNKIVKKKSLYDIYPKQENTIVMLGDSITYGVNWAEFIDPQVIGRGISGNTTKNIINRLNQVTDIKPKQLFILAGVNDFSKVKAEKDADEVKRNLIDNYIAILRKTSEDSPTTEIFVQSILPVNRDIRFFYYKDINLKIEETNKELENLCEGLNVTFVNLYDYFYEKSDMSPQYTNDGLHLSTDGYVRWKDIILPYMSLDNVPEMVFDTEVEENSAQ